MNISQIELRLPRTEKPEGVSRVRAYADVFVDQTLAIRDVRYIETSAGKQFPVLPDVPKVRDGSNHKEFLPLVTLSDALRTQLWEILEAILLEVTTDPNLRTQALGDGLRCFPAFGFPRCDSMQSEIPAAFPPLPGFAVDQVELCSVEKDQEPDVIGRAEFMLRDDRDWVHVYDVRLHQGRDDVNFTMPSRLYLSHVTANGESCGRIRRSEIVHPIHNALRCHIHQCIRTAWRVLHLLAAPAARVVFDRETGCTTMCQRLSYNHAQQIQRVLYRDVALAP